MMSKPDVRRTSSLILGIASAILSYWLLGFFTLASAIVCFTQFTRHTGQTWRNFAFVITSPDQIGYVLGCLALAAVLGGLGLWMVRAELRGSRTVSLGASAVRFCLGGLVGAALNVMVISGLLAYRWFA